MYVFYLNETILVHLCTLLIYLANNRVHIECWGQGFSSRDGGPHIKPTWYTAARGLWKRILGKEGFAEDAHLI